MIDQLATQFQFIAHTVDVIHLCGSSNETRYQLQSKASQR